MENKKHQATVHLKRVFKRTASSHCDINLGLLLKVAMVNAVIAGVAAAFKFRKHFLKKDNILKATVRKVY